MPVTPLIATHLRAIGHDAVHAHEIGLDRAADIELLDVARRQGRVIVTADLDYPRLLALQPPRHHPVPRRRALPIIEQIAFVGQHVG
jgi:predicted nuclease of predicted toxin-antitoxin system